MGDLENHQANPLNPHCSNPLGEEVDRHIALGLNPLSPLPGDIIIPGTSTPSTVIEAPEDPPGYQQDIDDTFADADPTFSDDIMTNPTFKASPGEDAELFIKDCLAIASGKPDPDSYAAALFRGGIQGRRAKAWYNSQSKETKRDWEKLSKAFIEEFDQDDPECKHLLAGEVRSLKRRNGELLVDFVRRTQKLADKVQGDMGHLLAETFLYGMRDGEADTALQLRLQDRLEAKELFTEHGTLKPDVTFRTIRRHLGQVATPLGAPNIYDERKDYENEDWEATATPEERIACAFEQMAKRLTSSVPSSQNNSSALSPVTGNAQKPYTPGFDFRNMQCFRCGKIGHGSKACTGEPLPIAEQRKLQEHYNRRRNVNQANVTESSSSRSAGLIAMDPEDFARLGFGDPYIPSRATELDDDDAPITYIGIEHDDDADDDAEVMTAQDGSTSTGARPRKRTRQAAFTPSGNGTPAMASPPTQTASQPHVPQQEAGPSTSQPANPPSSDEVPELSTLRDFLAKHKAELEGLRGKGKSTSKGPPRDTIPARIMAEGNLARFDVRDWLAQTPITITAAQLVDSSARIKSQFIRAMAPSVKRAGGIKRKGKEKQVGTMGPDTTALCGLVNIEDWGDEAVGMSTLGYIRTCVNGLYTTRALLDGGAVIDIISPSFVEKLGVTTRPAGVQWKVRLADDKRHPVTECVSLKVITEGIATILTAYVMSMGESFDILLSRTWLKRVRAIEYHADDVLEISGQKGVTKQIPIFPAARPKMQIEFEENAVVVEPVSPENETELEEEDALWDVLFYAIDNAAELEEEELAEQLKEYL